LVRPNHVTTDPVENPVPAMVKVTALAVPAVAEDGVMLVMDGAAPTVNVS
jgi:hypothetical protein